LGDNIAIKDFFFEQSEQSQIKAKIVNGYFAAWSRVMLGHWSANIAYIDLYCGPGKYKDGGKSVPLALIEQTLANHELKKRMQFVFNDVENAYTQNLEEEIRLLPDGGSLLNSIQFANIEIGTDFAKSIKIPANVPVLSFVDPWGYKGLTMDLIGTLIKNNGSDCIFFFNYNRINMALSDNKLFDEHLKGIFGTEKTVKLKQKLESMNSVQREPAILKALIEVLGNNGANYILPFKFYSQEMSRTSHFIIFVTKHQAGYKIMKEIMYVNSAKDLDGVASFSFEDSYNFGSSSGQLTFFSKLDDLCEELQKKYAGNKTNVDTLCSDIVLNPSNLFVESNVKDALRRLEENRIITVEGRKQKTRNGKVTMPNTAYVIFRK
jgi:three-Cys-motif partner protein